MDFCGAHRGPPKPCWDALESRTLPCPARRSTGLELAMAACGQDSMVPVSVTPRVHVEAMCCDQAVLVHR